MNPLKVLCLTVCVLTGITTTFSEYMTQTISVDDKKMKISEYAFDKYPILKSFYKDQYFIDRIQNTSQCKVIFNHLKKSVQNFIEDLKKRHIYRKEGFRKYKANIYENYRSYKQ